MRRYLPVLLTIMPCRIAEGEMQMTVGKMYSPERSGGAIFAAWKYVGLQNASAVLINIPLCVSLTGRLRDYMVSTTSSEARIQTAYR